MEGDKLITYWDDCGNCGEKYSLDGSFIVSPDWSPDVQSSRLQGFHCISSTAAAHALMLWVTAYFVVFSFHFPFLILLWNLSWATADIFKYPPALIP